MEEIVKNAKEREVERIEKEVEPEVVEQKPTYEELVKELARSLSVNSANLAFGYDKKQKAVLQNIADLVDKVME